MRNRRIPTILATFCFLPRFKEQTILHADMKYFFCALQVSNKMQITSTSGLQPPRKIVTNLVQRSF